MNMTHNYLASRTRLHCCGVVLHHETPHDGTESGMRAAADALIYWTEHRARHHVCRLVSPDNPYGLDRLDRQERAPAGEAHAS